MAWKRQKLRRQHNSRCKESFYIKKEIDGTAIKDARNIFRL